MSTIIVMAFDLSTTCTGVTTAVIANNKLTNLRTQALLPEILDPTTLGFLPTRRKVKPVRGKPFDAFVKHSGEVISKTEKERRDTVVKMAAEKLRIQSIAAAIDNVVAMTKPDLVLMEANMAFRSMNVTKQLGEMAGILQGIAIHYGIAIEKMNVHSARSGMDLMVEMANFAKDKDPKWLKKIDLTKETIKHILLRKYNSYTSLRSDMTTDESDSLLIFDSWYVGRLNDAGNSR